MKLALKTSAALAATIALSACGGLTARPSGFNATLPPAPAAPVQAQAPSQGAIFQTAGGFAPLHVGNRAQRVGDLVTVVLLERTQTSKSASASTGRDGGISLTPPSMGPFSFDPGNINSSGSSSFNGGGDAAQSSTLRGEITVTIAEVRPNGTALIRGEKLMKFSQGEEWIQLSGIVRLSDIGTDNRVGSPRIADALITYGGRGDVQRASNQGWLTKFFNIVAPF